MHSIADRLAQVRERIALAARACNRDPASITLLAVSKTKPVSAVQQAIEAGQRHFGENYLQDALEKIQALPNPDLVWHFIGPIQSNKTRAIAEHFDWVHSVDRLKIAQRLNDQRPEGLPPLNVCIQVNISREDAKAGILPEGAAELARAVNALPRLRLRGLMAIPRASKASSEQLAPLQALTALQKQIKTELSELDTLSMGMSADLEAAVAAGATLVRIGTDIFGARQ